ncbi:hypothetical protein BJ742DRAFT_225661 [Cladochytrium replicatum]|nr:hypothetical protein BJ742DRAFT_225661 [Cladochytrium replicatum]
MESRYSTVSDSSTLVNGKDAQQPPPNKKMDDANVADEEAIAPFTPDELPTYLFAAAGGDAEAQLLVGWAYQNGVGGVERDKGLAAMWYGKAAELGNPKGMFNIGICYANGFGVNQNYALAIEWYAKAAEMGHTDALLTLGWSYENGSGVDVDPDKAVYYYKKAAESGNGTAQFNLAVCYEEGFGVEEDPVKAMYWYERAAEQGDSGAAFLLGVAYENGMGVDRDPARAIFWYEKAAEAGDAGAMFILGVAYESGFGVEADSQRAFMWFKRAAENGYVYANIDQFDDPEDGVAPNDDYADDTQLQMDEDLDSFPSPVPMNSSSDGASSHISIQSVKQPRRMSSSSWRASISIPTINGLASGPVTPVSLSDDSAFFGTSPGSNPPFSPIQPRRMSSAVWGGTLGGLSGLAENEDDEADDTVSEMRTPRFTLSRRPSLLLSQPASLAGTATDDTLSIAESVASSKRWSGTARRPSKALLTMI